MKNQTLASFIIFTCFLVIGYSVSTKFYISDDSNMSNPVNLIISTSTNEIRSMNNGQRSILLIGVDTIEGTHPKLTSLWLVSYFPTDLTLRLFPIFPTGKGTVSNFEKQLPQTFDMNRKDGKLTLSQDFIETLSENNYWWSGYFIFDHVALTELITHQGKGGLNGQTVSGNQTIQKLMAALDDPQAAYSTHLAIVQTACRELAGVEQVPDWSEVTSQVPTHILTDMNIHQFITEWDASLTGQHKLICKFPTLEISRIEN